ncbi:MAG: hypothetical protein KatS3mg077_2229 [Candidatus Binatia bacterium]|nr:MAG: hypothetical protein KatS3mg077_2229 [Candidatus Binatia bacterium]
MAHNGKIVAREELRVRADRYRQDFQEQRSVGKAPAQSVPCPPAQDARLPSLTRETVAALLPRDADRARQTHEACRQREERLLYMQSSAAGWLRVSRGDHRYLPRHSTVGLVCGSNRKTVRLAASAFGNARSDGEETLGRGF